MKSILMGTALVAAVVVAFGCEANAVDVKPEIVEKIEAALPAEAPAKPKQPRKVLIFSKTNGFRHGSIATGVKALTMLGEKTGAYTATHTEDDAAFEPDSLMQYDAVIMLNTTGELFRPKNLPEDKKEREAALAREERLKKSLVDFVKSGKGLAGTHSATDTYKNWKEYNDMMGGAFVSHPWHMPVPIRVLDAKHPLNQVFGGEGFTITDEIYQFRNDTALPADRRMLLSLAPDFDGLTKGSREDGFYPVSWISTYGDGRTFYCSLGHRDEIYYNPAILKHYLAGFQYALGDLSADADPIDVPANTAVPAKN
ncbi:ThuA domain-containing protein [Lignipirellula cremea]|uniref:Trehalose utilization n=1 Tax=Lignipirellula cremea TaxID=2528010 RepID=A0A518DU32_9BACT|nr:ThuA domain-containing protein [Lignipirellula cremea]QDU95352.1 Trehalose utilization [Lignipirellula cremea]